jgi:hypothetical protein
LFRRPCHVSPCLINGEGGSSSEYHSNYFSIENMSILFQISKVYSKCQEYFFYPSNVRSIFQLTRVFFYYQMLGVFFVKWQVYFQLSTEVFFEGYECFATDYNIFQLTQLLSGVFFNWQGNYFSVDKRN